MKYSVVIYDFILGFAQFGASIIIFLHPSIFKPLVVFFHQLVQIVEDEIAPFLFQVVQLVGGIAFRIESEHVFT